MLVLYWGARLFRLLKIMTAFLKLMRFWIFIHRSLESRIWLLFSETMWQCDMLEEHPISMETCAVLKGGLYTSMTITMDFVWCMTYHFHKGKKRITSYCEHMDRYVLGFKQTRQITREIITFFWDTKRSTYPLCKITIFICLECNKWNNY